MNPYPWQAIVEKKRRAAERAEERAARLRAEAEALEAEHDHPVAS